MDSLSAHYRHAVTASLWDSALWSWYGPATPLMERIRDYGPNRHGELVLRRWLRVVLFRAVAMGSATMGLLVEFHPVGVHPHSPQDATFPSVICFVFAAAARQFSLIRLVLRPGEVVRFGAFRHIVIPCTAVRKIGLPTGRDPLTLDTYGGQSVALYWFYGSFFDFLYDFSQVCDHALSAHVRENARRRPEDRGTFRWTFNRSPVAATLWGAMVAALVYAVVRVWL